MHFFRLKRELLLSYINDMKIASTIVVFLFLILLSWGDVFAQKKMVEYSTDFEFKNGIYLSINEFKNNAPIPISKIIFHSNKDDKDFLKYVMDESGFKYIDSTGKELELKTNSVWGYCSNGAVFINHGTSFNRVGIIGSICHFVGLVKVRIAVSDPFYYNQSYGSMPPQYTYVSEQLILDFESGSVLEFNVENMEYLLQRDEEILKEFDALKKKKKRDSIFLYLRKYNEKYPIYFPE